MFESFLITSRETLEAALVVGIVLSFLSRTGQDIYKKWVWSGVLAGIGTSILVAILFLQLAGGFEGKNEALFEGTTMFVAAGLLTTMIFWMMKQRRSIKQAIEQRVTKHLDKAGTWGIFFVVAIAILREGTETVIFLNAIRYSSDISLLGGIAGIVTAIAIGYGFFVSTRKVDLQTFFTVSSLLLILFAAGLVAHGVHEFEEAGIIHGIIYPVWDLNPALVADGSYPLLHEKGAIGSFFVGLFGYNGNPSLVEVIVYLLSLSSLLYWYRRLDTSTQT